MTRKIDTVKSAVGRLALVAGITLTGLGAQTGAAGAAATPSTSTKPPCLASSTGVSYGAAVTSIGCGDRVQPLIRVTTNVSGPTGSDTQTKECAQATRCSVSARIPVRYVRGSTWSSWGTAQIVTADGTVWSYPIPSFSWTTPA